MTPTIRSLFYKMAIPVKSSKLGPIQTGMLQKLASAASKASTVYKEHKNSANVGNPVYISPKAPGWAKENPKEILSMIHTKKHGTKETGTILKQIKENDGHLSPEKELYVTDDTHLAQTYATKQGVVVVVNTDPEKVGTLQLNTQWYQFYIPRGAPKEVLAIFERGTTPPPFAHCLRAWGKTFVEEITNNV